MTSVTKSCLIKLIISSNTKIKLNISSEKKVSDMEYVIYGLVIIFIWMVFESNQSHKKNVELMKEISSMKSDISGMKSHLEIIQDDVQDIKVGIK